MSKFSNPSNLNESKLIFVVGAAVLGFCLATVISRRSRRKEASDNSNRELDAALEDTFPASDPVSTY